MPSRFDTKRSKSAPKLSQRIREQGTRYLLEWQAKTGDKWHLTCKAPLGEICERIRAVGNDAREIPVSGPSYCGPLAEHPLWKEQCT